MISPVRRRYLLLAAILLLLGLSPWAGYHLWQRLCGNKPIRFYGQLVDQAGFPIAKAKVIFHTSRDTTLAVPIMHFPEQVHEEVVVYTDSNGEFSLTSGYATIFVVDVWINGVCVNECMTPGKGSLTFEYDTIPGCLRIPDDPSHRIVYQWKKSLGQAATRGVTP